MSQPEALPFDDELHGELVAYLDGELDEEARRQIEDRLANDPKARNELVRLQKAWDLLDQLPRSEVDESFTQTTVEMVAVAATADLEREKAAGESRQTRTWLLAAGGALAAGIIGFLAVSHYWPDPNRQLLENLPVVENLELYRQADNIQFLHELRQRKLFADEEVGDGT